MPESKEQRVRTADHPGHGRSEASIVETLQSLIVAFVLAMAFRGFVVEGFVIPTGSMAPTLLGRHVRYTSPHSGYTFQVEAGEDTLSEDRVFDIIDPMLGDSYPIERSTSAQLQARSYPGDRILVQKYLPLLSQPRRWQVAVFKNPTNPQENYIKRLVGMPGEELWLADGDVFTRTERDMPFQVRRKPEHVQRAVWQPIYNSDWRAIDPNVTGDDREAGRYGEWLGRGWDFGGRLETPDANTEELPIVRSFRYDDETATTLRWNNARRPLNDWNAYNQTLGGTDTASRRLRSAEPVADLRIAAGIRPDQDGMQTTLRISARTHVFEFAIEDNHATVRYRSSFNNEDDWIASTAASIDPLAGGRTTNVEFWHVDQTMHLYIDRERIVSLEYHWDAGTRMKLATGSLTGDTPSETELEWSFEGSPVRLHRVQVDRDLYYRASRFDTGTAGFDPGEPMVATHPDYRPVLGADQFFACGDNSAASHDSRAWGHAHPLVERQVDQTPFVINRSLLVGRAFLVYFPAPLEWREDSRRIVPNFGEVRFIR